MLPVERAAGRRPARRRDYAVARRRRRVPRPHDVPARPPRAATPTLAPCGARSGRNPKLAVVDPSSSPRKAELQLRRGARLHAAGLLPRGQDVHADRGQRARPADRQAARADGDRRALRQRAASMAGIWTSQRRSRAAFGAACRRPCTCSPSPRRRPGATAKPLESAFLANGMQADALKKVLADAVSASLTFDRLIEGFMGLGLIVGVAALGRGQRALGRRAPAADRRPARDRLPPRHGAGWLPARVVVRRADVDRRRHRARPRRRLQRHPDTQRQPSWQDVASTCRGSRSVIFLAVYGVAMATTLAPARRASRVYPAEALHYQSAYAGGGRLDPDPTPQGVPRETADQDPLEQRMPAAPASGYSRQFAVSCSAPASSSSAADRNSSSTPATRARSTPSGPAPDPSFHPESPAH